MEVLKLIYGGRVYTRPNQHSYNIIKDWDKKYMEAFGIEFTCDGFVEYDDAEETFYYEAILSIGGKPMEKCLEDIGPSSKVWIIDSKTTGDVVEVIGDTLQFTLGDNEFTDDHHQEVPAWSIHKCLVGSTLLISLVSAYTGVTTEFLITYDKDCSIKISLTCHRDFMSDGDKKEKYNINRVITYGEPHDAPKRYFMSLQEEFDIHEYDKLAGMETPEREFKLIKAMFDDPRLIEYLKEAISKMPAEYEKIKKSELSEQYAVAKRELESQLKKLDEAFKKSNEELDGNLRKIEASYCEELGVLNRRGEFTKTSSN